MGEHTVVREVAGPWSLATSRTFWEGFAPAALRGQRQDDVLRTVFRVERDWSAATATIRQDGTAARITVSGDGDLDAAAEQTARFLALDVDGRGWPAVGERDPVIAAAQAELPGLRPCGFHSPYEAAAWAVLSQRLRIAQAARLRDELVGDDGAFPAPEWLRTFDADLPGRKVEYLHAVAEAALDGTFAGLRQLPAEEAIARVQRVKGLGPFAAELVVLRGANHPDGVPRHESRFEAEVAFQYGPQAITEHVSAAWRPYRTWAVLHLRAIAAARG